MSNSILVFDESPLTHTLFKTALEGSNIELTQAQTLERFKTGLQTPPPKVIFVCKEQVDQNKQVARSLEQAFASHHPSIILMTQAKTKKITTDNGKYEWAASDTLRKPFEASQLYKFLHTRFPESDLEDTELAYQEALETDTPLEDISSTHSTLDTQILDLKEIERTPLDTRKKT